MTVAVRPFERGPTPAERRAADNEAAFIHLRRGGMSSRDAGRQLGLTESQLERVSRNFNIEHGDGGGMDSSCPRFARHADHVRLVLSQGGFVRRVQLPTGALVEVRP